MVSKQVKEERDETLGYVPLSPEYMLYAPVGYGDPQYLSPDADTAVPVIGLASKGTDVPGASPMASLTKRLDDDTIYRNKTRSDDSSVPNSGLLKAGALYQLEDTVDDPKRRLPEASRNLAVLVRSLGVPSPENTHALSIAPDRKGTFKDALRDMPHPEPAEHAREDLKRNDSVIDDSLEYTLDHYAGHEN